MHLARLHGFCISTIFTVTLSSNLLRMLSFCEGFIWAADPAYGLHLGLQLS